MEGPTAQLHCGRGTLSVIFSLSPCHRGTGPPPSTLHVTYGLSPPCGEIWPQLPTSAAPVPGPGEGRESEAPSWGQISKRGH